MLYMYMDLHITTITYTTYELQYNYTSQIELQLIYLHRYCLNVNFSSH